ncbi:MAG: lactate racemase domain-containing protein [Planctomycetota bacterium]
MRVAIKYGLAHVELRLPDERVAGCFGAGAAAGAGAPEARAFPAAIEELAGAGLPAAAAGRRVGLLLADGTRQWEPELLLPPLLPLLGSAASVTAFLATGTHDPGSPENAALARRAGGILAAFPGPELVVNDCRRSPHRRLGATRRWTPVEVHARAVDCDLILTVADMKHHYFAGYSNAVKYLVPGIASLESIRRNHSLALEEDSTFGRHPWHPDPARRANPLAEDLLEAFRIAAGDRPHFALALVTGRGGIRWAGGGPTEEVTRRGIEVVDRTGSLRLAPERFLVLSAGGQPYDESLYTAQRALELSRAAVLPGGEVLFLARCPNGIGPSGAREHFYAPLTRPLAEIVAMPRADYQLYGHKPVKFARYLEGLSAVHLHSALPPEDVRRIHLHPAADPQAVLDAWLAAAAPGDRITVLDDAARLAVLPASGPRDPSTRFAAPAREGRHKGGQDEQGEEGRGDEPADDHRR